MAFSGGQPGSFTGLKPDEQVDEYTAGASQSSSQKLVRLMLPIAVIAALLFAIPFFFSSTQKELNVCLDHAQEKYQQDFHAQCTLLGKSDGCSLPASIETGLLQTLQLAKAACEKSFSS